jgi:hypothetical protein
MMPDLVVIGVGVVLVVVGIVVALYFAGTASQGVHVYAPEGYTIIIMGLLAVLIGARAKE